MRCRSLQILLLSLLLLLFLGTGAADHPDGLNSLADLQAYLTTGKRVGVQTGVLHEAVVEELFQEAECVYADSLPDLAAMLETGKIDAYLLDKPQAIAQCAQNSALYTPDIEVTKEDYGIAFAPDHETLRAEFNVELDKLRQNGELDALLTKWFQGDEAGRTMSALPENGERGILILTTDGGEYPFAYFRDGMLVGYEVELFGRICTALGYGCEVRIADFSGVIAAVSKGRTDAALGAIAVTAERAEQMLFSTTEYDGGVVVMLPASLKHVPAAAQEDTTASGGAPAVWSAVCDSFERTFLRENRWQLIVQGLLTTLQISVFSALLGTILGFGVCMMRRAPVWLLSVLAKGFVLLMQGTPIVVFLMILYYIVFGDVDPVLVAIVGFGLNFAAYVSEMMRAGIDTVDKGQMEAAEAIGFSKVQTFVRITLPQAARHFLPVFRGEFISLVKMTSVVGYISIMDLTKMSDIIRSRTYEAFFPLIATAVVYFILSWLLALVLILIEKRIDPKRRKRCIRGVREEGPTC